MRYTTALAVVCAMALASRASADVRLTMADGQVWLSAKNATVPQILAEWARVGQTRIVNGERVMGAPLTIELTNMPEAQALDIILRSAGGYLLAPRSSAAPHASRFDRILVLPAGTAAAAPVPATPSQPRFDPQPLQPDDVPEPDEPDAGDPAARGPAFSTFPPPNALGKSNEPADEDDIRQSPPPAAPEAPAGVARPGMLVPTPPATPQPGARLPTPQR